MVFGRPSFLSSNGSAFKFGRKRFNRTAGRRRRAIGMLASQRPGRVKINPRALPKWLMPEIKKFDFTGWTNETIDSSVGGGGPSYADLVTPALGDTVSSRQGNRIYVKYLVLQGQVVGSTSAVNAPIRFTIGIDKSANGISFATTGLAQVYAIGANGQYNLYAPRNTTTTSRFQILRDYMWTVGTGALAAGTGNIGNNLTTRQFKIKIPINKTVTFQNSGGSAVPETNHIWAMAYSDLNANTPQISMNCRAYYTDA